MGIRKFKAHAQYCFCNKCGLEKLKKSTEVFEKATGIKVRKVYRNKDAHNPVFYVDVNNRALAVFVLSAERLLRKEIVCGNVPKKIALRYVKGLMEGDGSLNLKIDNGKVQGMYLELFESNEDASNDVVQIFKKYFSIELRTYRERNVPNGRQMKSINLDDLLKLASEGVIPRKYLDKVKQRIALAFKKRETPWILVKLAENFDDQWFSSTEASKILSKSRSHTLEKMKSLEQKGYLISIKVKLKSSKQKGTPVRRLFRLTKNAMNVLKTLSFFLSPPSFLFP